MWGSTLRESLVDDREALLTGCFLIMLCCLAITLSCTPVHISDPTTTHVPTVVDPYSYLTAPDAGITIFRDTDVKGPTLFDDFFPPPRRGRPIRPPICFTMEATPSHTDPPGAEPDLGGM